MVFQFALVLMNNKKLSQVHFGDQRVEMISLDYLLKNKTKSNLLIQVMSSIKMNISALPVSPLVKNPVIHLMIQVTFFSDQ